MFGFVLFLQYPCKIYKFSHLNGYMHIHAYTRMHTHRQTHIPISADIAHREAHSKMEIII